MNWHDASISIQPSLEKLIGKLEKAMIRRHITARNEVLDLVKDAYANYVVTAEDGFEAMMAYGRLNALNEQVKGVYVSLMRDTYKDIKAGEIEVLTESYYRKGYLTHFFTGKGIPPLNPLLSEASVTSDIKVWQGIRNFAEKRLASTGISPAGETLMEALLKHNTTALQRTLSVVKQGLITGRSYKAQVPLLKKVFNNNSYNTLRIIRTEGNRALNSGSYFLSETMKDEGVNIRRMWVATLDSHTRESHQRLDGTYEDEDGFFWINGQRGRYPGDFEDPAESIHCRCTTIDVVDGVPPKARRGVISESVDHEGNITHKETEIFSWVNYDEWRQQYG